ncbi:hypothetical protein G6F68_015873 [Rhizopus microsporus]|nr:hypothetical protein G6F68_015873 [Rhizopus microsporus]
MRINITRRRIANPKRRIHKKKDCKPKKKSCDSDDDHSGKNWNPTGTYAAGDRVKYHGKTYVCLQGHTSNPTWTPDAAHSLWQTA